MSTVSTGSDSACSFVSLSKPQGFGSSAERDVLPEGAAAQPSPHRAAGQGPSPTGTGSDEQHGLLKKNMGLKRKDREHIQHCIYEDQTANQDKLRTGQAMGPLSATHKLCLVPTDQPAAFKTIRRRARFHSSGCDL